MAATPADAQVVMHLYELRRESEMRKARNWFATFNPQSADDIIGVIAAGGTDENRYFRMVTSYWEMAAALVLHGAVNEQLFLDTQGELFFVFAKLAPHLQAYREKTQNSDAMMIMETVINRSDEAKRRLQGFTERFARMRALAAHKK
jgi:L-rhamnose mutarotase